MLAHGRTAARTARTARTTPTHGTQGTAARTLPSDLPSLQIDRAESLAAPEIFSPASTAAHPSTPERTPRGYHPSNAPHTPAAVSAAPDTPCDGIPDPTPVSTAAPAPPRQTPLWDATPRRLPSTTTHRTPSDLPSPPPRGGDNQRGGARSPTDLPPPHGFPTPPPGVTNPTPPPRRVTRNTAPLPWVPGTTTAAPLATSTATATATAPPPARASATATATDAPGYGLIAGVVASPGTDARGDNQRASPDTDEIARSARERVSMLQDAQH